jgi:hypothetical protein
LRILYTIEKCEHILNVTRITVSKYLILGITVNF